VAATLVSAFATAADRQAVYSDCMTAHGYTSHQTSAAAAQPPAPVSSPLAAPAPASLPQQAASPSGSMPSAVPTAAVGPEGPGRVELFPVTVYNPYYPPSVSV